ncbi:hypothetical protein FS837_006412 [Tulasnella sp. UAMH 9824]|nr:hypothetical protein FS837_006412 [Tulasnella sp. UAMH 9824]
MATSTIAYPLPPVEFARDGGEFYKHYDKIADELDNGMITGLKSSLDGLLIFAGLFAGINSAFLALTLPKMSADPADDTNALLLQLVRGNNETALSLTLPSTEFSPKRQIYTINFLFLVSLASALFASFFAVIGKQWLAYYQTPEGSGGDKQRGEQLKRSQGAERWRLVPILDGLIPLLLQFALVIFAVGIILYLHTLSDALAYTMVALSSLAFLGFCLTIGVSFWDPYSPYRTPASQLFNWCCDRLITVSMHVLVLISRGLEDAFHMEVKTAGDRNLPLATAVKGVGDQLIWKLPLQRKADPPAQLQGDFVRRILAVSADREAIFQAALNIHVVRDPHTIRRIVEDEVAVGRLREFFMDLKHGGPAQYGPQRLPKAMGRDAIAFGGAILHLALYNKPGPTANSGLGWSPDTIFQSSTGFASLLVVERPETENSAMPSLPVSYSIMWWLWESWSEDRSPAQLLTFKTAASLLPPLPLQTTAFIALSLTLSRELEVADPSWTFASWSTSLFSDIQDVFWKKEMDDDLTEIICNALYTCTRLWNRSPSLQVYIALLKGVGAQVRQADLSNDVYYLRPIIRTVNEVSLYIAFNIISLGEDPQEEQELELWLALRSAALNTTHACLEHSIAALRPGLDDETVLRHRENITLIVSQVATYLHVLLDEQPATKFADVEALRALQPLVETISGDALSTKPQFQDRATKESIKDLVEHYHSMKRVAERNMQTAKLTQSVSSEQPLRRTSL